MPMNISLNTRFLGQTTRQNSGIAQHRALKYFAPPDLRQYHIQMLQPSVEKTQFKPYTSTPTSVRSC